jgi:hypothetical protein
MNITCLGQEFISYLLRAIVLNFTLTAAFVLWIAITVHHLHKNCHLSFFHNNCDANWTVHFRMTWSLEGNFVEVFCGSRITTSRFEKNHVALFSPNLSPRTNRIVRPLFLCCVGPWLWAIPFDAFKAEVVRTQHCSRNHILSYSVIQMEMKLFGFYLHEAVGTLTNVRSTVLYVWNEHNLTAKYKYNPRT